MLPLRILLLSDYSDGSGGVERLLEALRNDLRRLGHTVCWLSTTASSRETPHADELCFGTTGRLRGLLQFCNPSAALTLRRVIREFKPDVVHVAMFLTQLSPAILPLLAQVPTLYNVHWYRPICLIGTRILPDGRPCQQCAGLACLQNRCLPPLEWLPLVVGLQLYRRWANVFRLVVTPSKYVTRQLNAWGCPATLDIANGIEAVPARPPLTGPPLVVFAGRLVPEKGVHLLIQACLRLPQAKLLIVGDGPQLAALRALASPQVEFAGHLSRAAMEARFQSAWVQVVPSVWQEPFGITAAEAQMRGTAVIVSDVGGLAELVTHGHSGFVTPPGNVDALTHALHEILSHRPTAEAMGQAGRANALQRFSMPAFTASFLDAYRSIIKQ